MAGFCIINLHRSVIAPDISKLAHFQSIILKLFLIETGKLSNVESRLRICDGFKNRPQHQTKEEKSGPGNEEESEKNSF